MIIALDLETTGLDTINDKIIEIALVKFDSKTFEVVDKFTSLVNPGINIPDLIVSLTGITNDDVLDSPCFIDLIPKIIDFIGDLPILGHNIYFDRDFLINNSVNISTNTAIDTFLLANILSFNEHSLSLESLSDRYKLNLTGAHRALNDVYATINLFEYQIQQINKLTKKKKEVFKYILSKSHDTGFYFVYNNYLLSNIDKIDKTIFLKYIVGIFPSKTFKSDKDDNATNENIESDFNSILDKLDNLELRENQTKMSKMVSSSFDSNTNILIEAPTGIGKTFAYLIPSIIYSLKNNQQVFISTSTKALQDQIFYKDLDFLNKNVGLKFSYSKLKGKSNYFGIFSFIRFYDLEDTFDNYKTSFLLKIILWLFETDSYELDELDFYPKEYSMQREINADSILTFSTKNLYSNREPIVIQRKKAKKSDIVIINNNILFQDIDSEGTILGKVKNLVIDEAHNLEDVVTNSLKKSISINDLIKSFDSIKKIIIKNKLKFNDLELYVEDVLFNLETLFGIFNDYLKSKISSDINYKKLLLKGDFYDNYIGDIDIKTIILSIMSKMIIIKDKLALIPDDVYIELNRELKILDVFHEILGILKDKNKVLDSIIIINYNDHKKLFIEYTLLNPGDYLFKNLWNRIDSCILTSATLKTSGSFNYINKILNLEGFSFNELSSDFDYSKQALLYIPDDIGSIKNNNDEVIKFLENFLLVVKGRTLVLFTAFYMIKEVYKNIFSLLKKENINIYAQGIAGGKHKLINFFRKKSKNSVLLGTDTFWEGIDISGDDLKYLVIHKIPFMVPSDPIFQARSILFSNSFLEYSIPKAVLKLKQGFGRLIRTKNDSGIIVFLDNRIYSTSWGKELFSAFSENIKYKKGSTKNLLDVLKK